MSDVIPFGNVGDSPKREIVRTPTLQALHSMMSKVQQNPKLGMLVIIGQPGVGKTTALRAFQKGRPAYYCKMVVPYDSPARGLPHIGTSLGVELRNALPHRTFRDLAEQMCGRAGGVGSGRRPILMIDEAQAMSDRLLETVRNLWDACNEDPDAPGYAMVLCGNATFPERFGKRHFEQFNSRVLTVWNIDEPELGDVEAICAHMGVSSARAVELLQRPAKLRGLREVARVIEFARVIVGANKPLDADAIQQAIDLLGRGTR